MKRFFLVIFILLPVQGIAQTKQACDFSVQCQFQKQAFSISFKSPSKDCSSDDQEIFLQANGKTSKLKLPPQWYYDISNVGNQSTSCKSGYEEYPLFPLEGSQALLVLRWSDRPGYDKVGVAVLDLAKSAVSDFQILGSSEKTSTGVLVEGKKFKIQLVQEDLKQMRCDCDAAFVEGWMEFWVANGKIEKSWASCAKTPSANR